MSAPQGVFDVQDAIRYCETEEPYLERQDTLLTRISSLHETYSSWRYLLSAEHSGQSLIRRIVEHSKSNVILLAYNILQKRQFNYLTGKSPIFRKIVQFSTHQPPRQT